MNDRIAAVKEEIEVINAMHAHVVDQADFKTTEYQRLLEIRQNLDERRLLALSQSKPIKAQEIAVKVTSK